MISGIIGLFFVSFVVIIALLLFVFWIWMLVDAIQNKGLSDGEKVGWVLAIVFFHFIGSLLYFFLGRPKGKTPLPFEPPVMQPWKHAG